MNEVEQAVAHIIYMHTEPNGMLNTTPEGLAKALNDFGYLASPEEAKKNHLIAEQERLLFNLVDPDECSFDHHGDCQTHGCCSPCPHAQAKRLLNER